MLNLSRLQLFHLGQVKKQSILMNAKQHAQAQQIATFSPGSGKSANASSMLKLSRLQLFHLGQGKRATHSEECLAAC
jgi:hypothetical protein